MKMKLIIQKINVWLNILNKVKKTCWTCKHRRDIFIPVCDRSGFLCCVELKYPYPYPHGCGKNREGWEKRKFYIFR